MARGSVGSGLGRQAAGERPAQFGNPVVTGAELRGWGGGRRARSDWRRAARGRKGRTHPLALAWYSLNSHTPSAPPSPAGQAAADGSATPGGAAARWHSMHSAMTVVSSDATRLASEEGRRPGAGPAAGSPARRAATDGHWWSETSDAASPPRAV